MPSNSQIEVSLVIPCLNEEDTLSLCLEKANRWIRSAGVNAEIIVADNGSTDQSVSIARRLGARVIPVLDHGYGAALIGGIEMSQGIYIIMGDADDSYDFSKLTPFLEKMRQGNDFVIGCRFKSGGGSMEKDAMPFLHRYFGNPFLTWLAQRMFHCPVKDIYCGLRAFRRDAFESLSLQCLGMEFAAEMILKAALFRKKITEVPIHFHKDKRKTHGSHLRTFRDGWRTLRFYLLMSPWWLYGIPGMLFLSTGFFSSLFLSIYPLIFQGIRFDVSILGFTVFLSLFGYQLFWMGLFAHTFSVNEKLLPPHPSLSWFFQWATLEKSILLSFIFILIGLGCLGNLFCAWSHADFSDLSYPHSVRETIFSIAFLSLGCQTFFSSFLISFLGLKRK